MSPDDGIAKGPFHQSDDSVSPGQSDVALTPRERDVVEQLILGKTDKEIAAQLGISRFTASTHVKRILAKLRVSTRSGAIARVLREPWILKDSN